jgi:hypothetical protein
MHVSAASMVPVSSESPSALASFLGGVKFPLDWRLQVSKYQRS